MGVLFVLTISIPSLLIGIPAALALRTERQTRESAALVERTLAVDHHIQGVLGALLDAESGQRGFLLTQREYYLEPYHSAVARLPMEMEALRQLTADNPVQRENFRQLNTLMVEARWLLTQTIALQQFGKRAAALELVHTDRGKNAMDEIRRVLASMAAVENGLLVVRQEKLTAHARTGSITMLALVGLNTVFAGATALLGYRLSLAQRLVKMCAWSRTIEFQGTWMSFEEYLQRRFGLAVTHGISPAEAEKSMTEAGLALPADVTSAAGPS